MLQLRPTPVINAPPLRHWDEQPHAIASDQDTDWERETELAHIPGWGEQLIIEVEGKPIGFIQIIDPAREDSHYWGNCAHDLRAIDIWIGDANYLNRGHGTQAMRLAIARCFAPSEVNAILIDPRASHTRAHRFYERLGFYFLQHRRFNNEDCQGY